MHCDDLVFRDCLSIVTLDKVKESLDFNDTCFSEEMLFDMKRRMREINVQVQHASYLRDKLVLDVTVPIPSDRLVITEAVSVDWSNIVSECNIHPYWYSRTESGRVKSASASKPNEDKYFEMP